MNIAESPEIGALREEVCALHAELVRNNLGRLADPPTFLFQYQPGPATLATLVLPAHRHRIRPGVNAAPVRIA